VEASITSAYKRLISPHAVSLDEFGEDILKELVVLPMGLGMATKIVQRLEFEETLFWINHEYVYF